MLRLILNKINDNDGSVMVFAVFFIVILIGATGLVVDSGIAYANKLHIQKATNAAALSSAQELLNDEAESIEIIEYIMEAHGIDFNTVEYNISGNEVSVYAQQTNETYFMKIFGKNEVSVSAEATAALVSKSVGKGAAPIGINKNINLVIGQSYILKFDESNQTNGWFGALRLDGNGANEYENSLINGSETKIEVNDIVDIQTGNMAGKTRNAVRTKIDACSHYSVDECINDDCGRILLVPVYEPYPLNYSLPVLSQVKIVGFAYFYLLEADGNGKSITGEFIEMSSSGYGNEELTNFGAYSIRLK